MIAPDEINKSFQDSSGFLVTFHFTFTPFSFRITARGHVNESFNKSMYISQNGQKIKKERKEREEKILILMLLEPVGCAVIGTRCRPLINSIIPSLGFCSSRVSSLSRPLGFLLSSRHPSRILLPPPSPFLPPLPQIHRPTQNPEGSR